MLNLSEINIMVEWLHNNEPGKFLQWICDNFGGSFCSLALKYKSNRLQELAMELLEYNDNYELMISFVELAY